MGRRRRREVRVQVNKGEIMNIRSTLLIAAAAGLAVLAAGCGENPDDVAKSWHSAILRGDLEKANRCVVATPEAKLGNEMWAKIISDLRKRSNADPEAKKALKKAEHAKFSPPEIAGDRATIRFSLEGEDKPVQLGFQKLDGKWKIADIK